MSSPLALAREKSIGTPGSKIKKPLCRGYKLIDEAPRRLNSRVLLTDAQVLECRIRWEFEPGWSQERLALTYGTSYAYMGKLLEYTVRSKLIPKQPDRPRAV